MGVKNLSYQTMLIKSYKYVKMSKLQIFGTFDLDERKFRSPRSRPSSRWFRCRPWPPCRRWTASPSSTGPTDTSRARSRSTARRTGVDFMKRFRPNSTGKFKIVQSHGCKYCRSRLEIFHFSHCHLGNCFIHKNIKGKIYPINFWELLMFLDSIALKLKTLAYFPPRNSPNLIYKAFCYKQTLLSNF
jgi:hypothetical protein